MYLVRLPILGTFNVWRDAARAFIAAGVQPKDIDWRFADQGGSLFDDAGIEELPIAPAHAPEVKASKALIDLARQVICHSEPERFALMYGLLARLQTNRSLLADRVDANVDRAERLAKNIRRDVHKMHAFVRFREVEPLSPGRRAFYAWFEPDHYIVERTSAFFAKRFADMDWMIATPKGCSHYRDGKVSFSEPVETGSVPADATDELWKTYYSSIFNPARVKIKAMQAEMPKKYWKNMPETELIPGLIAGAEKRVREMRGREASQPPLRARKVTERFRAQLADTGPAPKAGSLEELRAQAAVCTKCPIHCNATQTVFGAGPETADVMFVGEQPGDREDLVGAPFVGPAGQLFNAALDEIGFDRNRAYVTNAVKHFKFTPKITRDGKRRIHAKPNAGEIDMCKFWLAQEIQIVRPKLIVALGATAARATTGRGGGIMARRGNTEATATGTPVYLTIHPSAVLRAGADRQAEERAFREDLRLGLAQVA